MSRTNNTSGLVDELAFVKDSLETFRRDKEQRILDGNMRVQTCLWRAWRLAAVVGGFVQHGTRLFAQGMDAVFKVVCWFACVCVFMYCVCVCVCVCACMCARQCVRVCVRENPQQPGSNCAKICRKASGMGTGDELLLPPYS